MEKALILVIDDDPGLSRTLVDILRNKGYEVLAARDGKAGLSLLEKSSVDLALIDLSLPDIPGLEVLSKIKADHPATEAIILTGHATIESATEATGMGAFSYLVKPYEIDQLLLHVRRAIEKRRAEAALRESEAKFRALLESAPDGMLIVNAEQQILMVNEQFERLFGFDRSEIIGRPVEMLIPSRFGKHREYARQYLGDPQRWRGGNMGEVWALRKDGSEFPVEISLGPLETRDGIIVSAAIRDITERKEYERQLEYQASHDGLTGLPNRNLLADRIEQAILYARRHRRKVAVLFVDLDLFRFINDSLGHGVGDRLLKAVAKRLAGCVRSNDTLARQGGDEFVIVLPDTKTSEDAARVAKKIHLALNRPLKIDPHELEISCSIGISLYPKDGEDVPTLLKNADVAMFRAKEQGRGNFQFFTDELNDRAVERMTIEKHLRRALEREEFQLYYQPQVDLGTGRIVGMESLLRWHNPELGAVSPAAFIPVAEETGLILPIGEWVLRTACMQSKRWLDAGFSPLTMAVNLSPRQFWHSGLIGSIAAALQESGLASRYLELEIIESMVMRDVDSATAMARELKDLGVKLTIDDFGTGYSSLSYLKRFPFDKLKIDQSFVRDITSDPGTAAIVRAIIAMAHSLNLRVVAEGIETEGQLGYLRSHGCDDMQGFHFSRPVPPGQFEQMLREDRRLQFAPESDPFPKRTLLLVDDEAYAIEALKRILFEEGYHILTAANPSEGFEQLARNQVGVVLSDHRMPGMSGTEFLSRVKDLHPDTVRMVLTASDDLSTVTEAVNRGAIFKFLTKPWEADLLREDIREAFRHHYRFAAREEISPLSGRENA